MIAAVCVISVGLSNSIVIAAPAYFEAIVVILASGSVGATLGAKKGAELGRQYGQWLWPAGGAVAGIVAGYFVGAISGCMAYGVIKIGHEKVHKNIEVMRKKIEALREKFTK